MRRRPLRIQREGEVYVCSNRVFQNQELIPTDPPSTARIEGAMARYADIHGVALYAYSFVPSGFWMVLGTDDAATRQHFMRDFESWLATWINGREDREGRFVHERYDDEAIVEVASLINACIDATVVPVREGYAESLDEYTGATSWSWLKNGEEKEGEWIDRDRLQSLRRTNPDLEEEACARAYLVPLEEAPVEAYADDDGQALCEVIEGDESPTEHVRRRVKKRVERIVRWQSKLEPGELQRRRARPHNDPKNASPLEPMGPPKLRYSWLCRASSDKERRRYRRFRKKMRKRYTKVGDLWREGKEEFCGCCGGAMQAELQEGTTAALADGGAAVEETREESGTGHTCGEELDFPDSAIPYGWIETKGPLLHRTDHTIRSAPDPGG